MSNLKKMMVLAGLAIALAPSTISSRSTNVDKDMKKDIVKKENITRAEVDFQSTIAEMHLEELKQLKTKKELKKEYIGKFRITFYCACRKCNGKWYGYPAKNGEPLKEGYTIAVDPNVIPLNSYVEIYGRKFKACDTGAAIKGNRIDIFIDDHEKCYELGVKENVEVYLLKEQLKWSILLKKKS